MGVKYSFYNGVALKYISVNIPTRFAIMVARSQGCLMKHRGIFTFGHQHEKVFNLTFTPSSICFKCGHFRASVPHYIGLHRGWSLDAYSQSRIWAKDDRTSEVYERGSVYERCLVSDILSFM